MNNKKSICKCNIQGDILLLELKEEQIFPNIVIVKKAFNLDILKCYIFLFSKEGLRKNLGSYIILIIFLLYIILAIYFYLFGYNSLCNQINELLQN